MHLFLCRCAVGGTVPSPPNHGQSVSACRTGTSQVQVLLYTTKAFPEPRSHLRRVIRSRQDVKLKRKEEKVIPVR